MHQVGHGNGNHTKTKEMPLMTFGDEDLDGMVVLHNDIFVVTLNIISFIYEKSDNRHRKLSKFSIL